MYIRSTQEGIFACSLMHKHYSGLNMQQQRCAEMNTRYPKIEKERNVAMLDVKNVCAQLSIQFDLE